MGNGIVVVEKKATGAGVRTARAPGSENLGQTEAAARTPRYPADVTLRR